MDRALAKTFLREARELVSLANEAWHETYDTTAGLVEISISDPTTGEITPIAHVLQDCPFPDKTLMSKTPVLMRAVLMLFDEACDVIRANRPPEATDARRQQNREEAKNYAAECAMKCNDQMFRRFLVEEYKLTDVTDAERIAVKIRYILRIDTRNELNTDAGARNRWLDMRGKFEAWKRKVACDAFLQRRAMRN
jgi:hypothetical protein